MNVIARSAGYPLLSLFLGLFLSLPLNASSEYAGSTACADCHSSEHEQWQNSHHSKAMQAATVDTVLGDFDDISVEFHNIKSRFFVKNGQYQIETTNKDGQQETFNVVYTFGFEPLQQYILDTGNGHLQAFNIAWDTRDASIGGQRWFHLQPDIKMTEDHPFFWQRHFQNWNSRCAECHTTGYEKNYDADTHTYQSGFAEPNVGCESCHGPGQAHIDQLKDKQLDPNKGFITRLEATPIFQYAENDPIANLSGETNTQYMQQCAFCHSRRLTLGQSDNGAIQADQYEEQFHNEHSLSLLDSELYFDDGQIKDEVFVIGSFLQSKMAHAGVTCSNCHNPHSGNISLSANTVCSQCHLPDEFDTPKHHFHAAGSTDTNVGSPLCVDCHMPARTYMQVDDRRDHGFIIPSAKVSEITGSPNVCLGCHIEKDLNWVEKTLQQQYGNEHSRPPLAKTIHWSNIHTLSDAEKIVFTRERLGNQSPIVDAKLLSIINTRPTQESVSLAIEQLKAPSPLVRRAAIDVLSQLPPETMVNFVVPLLDDPIQSVRFQAAAVLANHLTSLSPQQTEKISSGLMEYKNSLLQNADSPNAQLSLAQLALAEQNIDDAKIHYDNALEIAPKLPAAQLGMANFWRATQAVDNEEAVLAEAAQMHPDFSEVLFQYGLYQVRAKQYEQASQILVEASELEDSQPYYAYVAAASLDRVEKTQQAIGLLLAANNRWPQQTNLLTSLALYSEKTNDKESLATAVDALKQLLPDNPQVRQWQQLLQQMR